MLIVVVVVGSSSMDAGGYLTAPYDFDYMSASLINAVPLAMLGLAELLVILSGRGGIDLSVGAIVSLAGMVFGFAYGEWGWPLWAAILLTAAFGALCGALNGFLVAYVGFPALIATLATFYAFKSLAIVINNQSPISTPPIQDLFSITRSVELPVFGAYVPERPARPVHLPAADRRGRVGAAGPHDLRPPALRDRHERRRRPMGGAAGARTPGSRPTSTPG